MKSKVSVIIPFYQEQPGILRRSVASVIAQTYVKSLHVIVIDDESPVPAAVDLDSLPLASHVEIRIIKQLNTGPGAARNKGLQHVSSDTEYVAFLDSDDEWSSDHLSRAVEALDLGYDLYFSDFFEVGRTTSAFNRNNLIKISDHVPMLEIDDLYEYCGNFFCQELAEPIAHTSTIVYRFRKFPEIRFSEQFRHAHEDTFWRLELARRKPRIAFSVRPECHLGTGANVHYGATWGTARALEIINNYIAFRKLVRNNYSLTKSQRQSNSKKLNQARSQFASNSLRIIRTDFLLGAKFLCQQIISDPASLFYVLLYLFNLPKRHFFRRIT